MLTRAAYVATKSLSLLRTTSCYDLIEFLPDIKLDTCCYPSKIYNFYSRIVAPMKQAIVTRHSSPAAARTWPATGLGLVTWPVFGPCVLVTRASVTLQAGRTRRRHSHVPPRLQLAGPSRGLLAPAAPRSTLVTVLRRADLPPRRPPLDIFIVATLLTVVPPWVPWVNATPETTPWTSVHDPTHHCPPCSAGSGGPPPDPWPEGRVAERGHSPVTLPRTPLLSLTSWPGDLLTSSTKGWAQDEVSVAFATTDPSGHAHDNRRAVLLLRVLRTTRSM